ncbi:Imm1 family immunity protein [Umezawaea endophytica]|uniref:Imm1 family immunity protein n=1 Tax=Umezawaea endophytica TaxID=1654476 RepID=UPI0023DE9907
MGTALKATYRHGHPAAVLRTREDIDAFVDALLAAGWEYTSATIYAVDENIDGRPDHELVIGADATTGLGAVRYAGDVPGDDRGEGEWFSRGDRANPQGVEFAYFGTGHDWPADAEVPLDVVRDAVADLLARPGARPAGVTWQVWQPAWQLMVGMPAAAGMG